MTDTPLRTRPRIKLVVKISVLQSALLFFAIAVTGFLNYGRHEKQILQTLQEHLQLAANTTSLSIDGDRFATLRGRESIATDEYREIQTILKRFLVNKYLGFEEDNVYAFRRISEDTLEFAVMINDDVVGERYGMRSEMLPVFDKGHPSYTGVYEDENGMWVSAYSPIIDSIGQVVGMIEVDFRNSRYLMALMDERQAILYYSLIGIGVAIIISGVLARLISRPIVEISLAAIEVSRGDFNQRVDVRTKDEIGTLGQAFNYMVSEIREKFRLHKYVSQSTLANVREQESLDTALHRRVFRAMFFSDIRGFTHFVERSNPETAVAVVNRYLSAQAKVIQEFGGDIDKFVGDEVMAVFSGNDMESQAVRCAVAVLEAVADLRKKEGYDLEIGIGLNCGQVVEGNIGSQDRSDHTVIGDAVNVAARLCAKAAPGTILISESMFRRLADRGHGFTLKSVGEMELKGKSQPMKVYQAG